MVISINTWTIHFDGSCWPNPNGKACYGFIIKKNGQKVKDGHGIIGQGYGMTNNVAEHLSLMMAFQALLPELDNSSIIQVYGDSQLVINQMSNRWGAKENSAYFPFYKQNKTYISNINKKNCQIFFNWIPREQNQECDDLSKIDNPTAKY